MPLALGKSTINTPLRPEELETMIMSFPKTFLSTSLIHQTTPSNWRLKQRTDLGPVDVKLLVYMETGEEKNRIDFIKTKMECINKCRQEIREVLGDISNKFGNTKSYYVLKKVFFETFYIFEGILSFVMLNLSSSMTPPQGALLLWASSARAHTHAHTKDRQMLNTF